jgi:predicted transcriptional regulator
MTDKQAVKEVLEQLPENTSLDEIIKEVEILAAIKRGRNDVATGHTKPHHEVQKLIASWASAWPAK